MTTVLVVQKQAVVIVVISKIAGLRSMRQIVC